MSEMSCVLGFDVGSKLIGVAIGNRFTASARALTTVAMRDGQPDWDRAGRAAAANGCPTRWWSACR